jgi:putative endonuclease
MHYVYILQSYKDLNFYVGVTSDLKRRFNEHNSGGCKYTSSKSPFKLTWYGAFINKELACGFEKYLKSSSGSAFRNKHLISKEAYESRQHDQV